MQVIKDFDQTDLTEQYIILQNAKELLAYLNNEYVEFPYADYWDCSKALLNAMNFIDDKLNHG